jgi:hypothetical protein
MAHVDHEDRIVEYLLGTLPAAEAERLEQEFLSDDSRYEDVLAVEDELLLEYARGRLALPDRTRVETRLLRTDEDRERLAWARALAAWFDTPQKDASRVWPMSFKYLVPIAAVVALAFAALIAQNLSLRRQVEQAEIARATAAQALADATAATVRLQLQLPAGVTTPLLAAVLRDVDGKTLWTGPASELVQAVTVDIPASHFATGDYEVVLRDGGQDRAEYYFSIIRS